MRIVRASDRDRERAAARLRRACVGGAIGIDTLETRLGRALRARTVFELRRLTADLPRPWDRLLERIPAFDGRDPAPRLAPAPDSSRLLIGRGPDCDVVLQIDTVSRRHALLRRDTTGWRLVDLDSTNGSYVNGVRVIEAPVAAGDRIELGGLTLTFAP